MNAIHINSWIWPIFSSQYELNVIKSLSTFSSPKINMLINQNVNFKNFYYWPKFMKQKTTKTSYGLSKTSIDTTELAHLTPNLLSGCLQINQSLWDWIKMLPAKVLKLSLWHSHYFQKYANRKSILLSVISILSNVISPLWNVIYPSLNDSELSILIIGFNRHVLRVVNLLGIWFFSKLYSRSFIYSLSYLWIWLQHRTTSLFNSFSTLMNKLT